MGKTLDVVIDEIREHSDGRMYQYIEYAQKLPDGTPYSEMKFLKTQEEIAEQQKQQRIAELETLIEKKKLRGYDYSVELQELEALDPIL